MNTGGEARTVELFQAFFWTCDECGLDNFERAVTVAIESIDPANLPEGFDAEMLRDWAGAGEEGTVLTAPSDVKCKFCEASFRVEHAPESIPDSDLV